MKNRPSFRGVTFAGLAVGALTTLASAPPSQAVPDQGITSAVHRQNVGRIQFSTSPIQFKREQPARFSKAFRATDRLWGRLYLPRSLANIPHFTREGHRTVGSDRGEFAVRVLVNGKEQRFAGRWFYVGGIDRKSRDKFTTFQVNLNPTDDFDADKKLKTNWARLVAKLAPGKHNVTVEVWGILAAYETRKPVAVGSFVLTKRPGDVLGGGKLPKAAMKNGAVERGMHAALKARRMVKRPGDVRKVVITSGWQYGNYRVTRVRYRMVNGTVLWRAKDGGPLCRFVTYKFVSDQRGGGWGPIKFRGFCNGCPEGWARCR